ncbi:SepL/TyeA/HrpJ family type III secretion system gatekeeper [Pandoraea faecigallinarum]|uniref:SepL/TyeA/HrpJ family type III secretion system gatekeeper n=1 Tax=Pandoraea faecigallinarum TaxID=656179 RepID=A0A0H3WUE5_9BURK|nr:TyeA family type III secretion system gatekeeper subunit [Pandoraea faecigallinarum]AKM31255.1 SepL/TyeA/HrpJ family type III secretion system gatekeeper [Pandoraea faecigallinarum]
MVERLPSSNNPRVGGTQENAALERMLDDEWQALEADAMSARGTFADVPGHVALIEATIAQNEEAAFAESQENLSFALGVRFRRTGERDVRDDRQRARALFEQQMHRFARVNGAQFERLRGQLRDLPFVPDPLQLIRQAQLSAGHAALVVAAWLADSGLDVGTRHRLRRVLDTLTASQTWSIEAFAALECGDGAAPGMALMQQLKSLFRQAQGPQRTLTQWFDECRRFSQRRARLRALMQALGLELGAQQADADTQRLSAVIDDLRRVVLFLTLESACESSARAVREAGCRAFDTDAMIAEVLTLLDQPWVGAQWLTQRASHLGMTTVDVRYAFARGLTHLVKSADEGCFRDDTQREALEEALDTWRTEIAQEGDAMRG